MAQKVKHLPTVWETWVRSLGQEDGQIIEAKNHGSFTFGNSRHCLTVLQSRSLKTRLAELILSEGCERECLPCLFVSFWWLQVFLALDVVSPGSAAHQAPPPMGFST